MKSVFEVDHKGMRQVYRGRGLHRMLYELVSNAFDEKVTRVEVELVLGTSGRTVGVVVRDDSPDGFRDLAEAWTMFAPSVPPCRKAE